MNIKPAQENVYSLLGSEKQALWTAICDLVESLYDMDACWGKGGKAWDYEYKYRRGGKTLCALYARQKTMGFMIIFGKEERTRFESNQASYSQAIQTVYQQAKTYHDGKWIMVEPTDLSVLDDIKKIAANQKKTKQKINYRAMSSIKRAENFCSFL